MQKRGQVYILTVIILAFVIYLLYTDTNIVKRTILDDDFEELSQNYDVESAKFVNYLLSNNFQAPDVRSNFENFTGFFTSYSKTKNPDFGLLYLFDYKNSLYIGNYLVETVKVYDEDDAELVALAGCSGIIPAGFKVAGGEWSIPGISVDEIAQCTRSVSTSSQSETYNIKVRIEDVKYEIEIAKGKPDIVIVGREDKGNERKVYTKGNFKEKIIDLDPENEQEGSD